MSNQHPLNDARALVVKGDIGGAAKTLGEFLNSDFFNYEALFMLGYCFLQQGLTGLSAVVTSAAIEARIGQKKEHFPEALMNLGSCYKTEGQRDTALKIWQEAVKHESMPRERARALTNIAGLFVNEGCPEQAFEWCRKALADDPNDYGAQVNQGMAHLEMGNWREGWKGFAATYNTGDRLRRRYIVDGQEVPEWDGSPNKRVIVFGDQGIGDELFFANSLPDMIACCRRVILDCHPRLDQLFFRSFPEITVHGTRKHLSELTWVENSAAEAAIGLADLPRFFRNEDKDWRGEPYLKAAEEPSLGKPRRAWPQDSSNRRGSPLRVGLSWTGGSKKTRQELRSLLLRDLVPIFQSLYGPVHWFSLQYTPNAAREVCELEEQTDIRISHYPGWVECYDYDRTASFVNSLDLIITVCTTVHHLGGALGVPTWTLVPSRPSWRYQVKGERLPWYDSVRVFRQEVDGDWSGPIAKIASELADFTGISKAAERAA